MNDFTKEELNDIYEALMETRVPIFEHLPFKIQSMIDNYCEHESIPTNLLINPIKVPGKDNLDVIFRWEGLRGYRRMLLEIERDGFSLPRKGVQDIKRMCEEFLNNEDRAHEFLRIGK
jgi:hypothetical protein